MKSFWLKCLIITSITILLTWLTSQIAEFRFFQLLFPETIAIKEFEFTDFAFDLKKPDHINDEITIINIGELDRNGIADLINILDEHRPSVIGLDVFFNCPGGRYDSINCPQFANDEATRNLSSAIASVDNIVLVSLPLQSRKLQASGRDGYDSLEMSDAILRGSSVSGHAVLSTLAESKYDVQACRTFDPQVTMMNGEALNAFAVEVAKRYDSAKAMAFLSKFGDQDAVTINFRGNLVKSGFEHDAVSFPEVRYFHALDAIDIITGNFPGELVRDRILLLEYVGTTLTSQAAEKQKLYTPLNRKKIGRTFPDMYPSVVHANIIRMIIDEDYIYEMSALQEFFLSFVICFFHIAALLGIRIAKPQLHDLVSVCLVFLLIGAIAFLRLVLFAEFNIKSDLTFTIGSLALTGIVVALYHDMLDSRLRALMKARVKVVEPSS